MATYTGLDRPKSKFYYQFCGGLDQTVVEDFTAGLDFLGGQEDVGSFEYSSHKTS